MQTTQTFNADGITISINVNLPFALARAAAGVPCCGCRCPRSHSGGSDVGGVGGSAPSCYASRGTSTDSQLTVAGSVSAELGISEGVVGRDGEGDCETTTDLKQIDSQETHVVSDSGVPVGCRLVHQIAEPEPRAAAIDRQDNERDEQSESEPCASAARWQGGCAQWRRQ